VERPENAPDGKNRVENYDFSMVYAPAFSITTKATNEEHEGVRGGDKLKSGSLLLI
jgi:hypothetical protein